MRRTFFSALPFAIALLALTLLGPTASAQVDAKLQIPDSDEGLPGAGPVRRADWFKKLWAERRAGFAAPAGEEQGAGVFFGDSITQGWNDDFRGAFEGMKVANRGISGDTSRGVLIRLKDDVLSLKPAAVVLMIGTNDLADNAEPETIAGNLKLIIAEIKKQDSKTPIVLCQVFPSSETK